MKPQFAKSGGKILLCVFFTLVLTITANSQVFDCKNCTIYIDGVGTGKTTGNVVYLTINNPNDKLVNGKLGPYYIPGYNNYQPYIIPGTTSVQIAAHDSLKVFLSGYCADITKKPVPSGVAFVPIEQWVPLNEKTVIPAEIIKVNPTDNPHIIGPIYLGAVDNITRAYDSMVIKGSISTPFSGNPEKEREAVIQQTFWIYTSHICGTSYTKNKFKERTYEQYEENTRIKVSSLASEQKTSLDKGIDDFWNTFELVGEQAKIIGTTSGPEVTVPKKDSIVSKPTYTKPVLTSCECKHCLWSDDFILIDSATKERYDSNEVPPNSTIIFRPQQLISHDCPDKCKPKYISDFQIRIYECDKVIMHDNVKDGYTRKLGKSGSIDLIHNAYCYCDEKLCDKRYFRKQIKIKEGPCCENIRCKKDYMGKLVFVNPDDPTSQVKIEGKNLFFSLGGKTGLIHSENFDFNLEDIFCTLSDDQIMSEVLVLSAQKLANGQNTSTAVQRSLRMNGITNWKTFNDKRWTDKIKYPDPYYGFQFMKSMTINGMTSEVLLTFSMDAKTCKVMVQIMINGITYEFISN